MATHERIMNKLNTQLLLFRVDKMVLETILATHVRGVTFTE